MFVEHETWVWAGRQRLGRGHAQPPTEHRAPGPLSARPGLSSHSRTWQEPRGWRPGMCHVNKLQDQPQALTFKTCSRPLTGHPSWESEANIHRLQPQQTCGSAPTRTFHLNVGGYGVWESHSFFTLIPWFLGKGYKKFNFLNKKSFHQKKKGKGEQQARM